MNLDNTKHQVQIVPPLFSKVTDDSGGRFSGKNVEDHGGVHVSSPWLSM